jgi:hypothetical protein
MATKLGESPSLRDIEIEGEAVANDLGKSGTWTVREPVAVAACFRSFTNADVRALSARILFRDFCAILAGHRSIAARKNSPDACLAGAPI